MAESGESISEQTGLGSSWFGTLFLKLSTSLPEISTVQKAVRMGMPRLAFSDISGTNLFALCFWWTSPSRFRRSSVGWVRSRPLPRHSASLLTSTYAGGLIERRDTAVGSLGLDSWFVRGDYLRGLAILFSCADCLV